MLGPYRAGREKGNKEIPRSDSGILTRIDMKPRLRHSSRFAVKSNPDFSFPAPQKVKLRKKSKERERERDHEIIKHAESACIALRMQHLSRSSHCSRSKGSALPEVQSDLIDMDYDSPLPQYPDFVGDAQPGRFILLFGACWATKSMLQDSTSSCKGYQRI